MKKNISVTDILSKIGWSISFLGFFIILIIIMISISTRTNIDPFLVTGIFVISLLGIILEIGGERWKKKY